MKRTVAYILLVTAFMFTACKKEIKMANLTLHITHLQNLAPTAIYEGWVMVNGNPVSTGKFMVDSAGNMSATQFTVDAASLQNATAFLVSVESIPDHDPGPSGLYLLGGDFNNGSANLSVGYPAALGFDFATASGQYILGTFTDGDSTNENSGLWWLDPTGGNFTSSLSLPVLSSQWTYEGWVVIDSVLVSTGKFSNTSAPDEFTKYGGVQAAPAFPGEDFLTNPPSGLSFPTDLSGDQTFISIEPEPDNDSGPFLLRPLTANIPDSAQSRTLYPMMNNTASFPAGTATR